MAEHLSDIETLTDDDRGQLRTIHEALHGSGVQFAALIHDYYSDVDRANRTSRPQMYLHMGMLAGMIMRLQDRREKP